MTQALAQARKALDGAANMLKVCAIYIDQPFTKGAAKEAESLCRSALAAIDAALEGGVVPKVKALEAGPLVGKYGDVLLPFVNLMEHELHANSGKGDRPGWLAMDRKTALLEIFYHLAKLQKATKDDDQAGIREYGADVANMAMMLVDICGALDLPSPPTGA